MSGGEEEGAPSAEPEKLFYVDRAKTGRAGCKKCKQKIDAKSLRIARIGANPFGDGTMKFWHHVPCLFEAFQKQRATTARINSPDDIDGWDSLPPEDQQELLCYIAKSPVKTAASPAKRPAKALVKTPTLKTPDKKTGIKTPDKESQEVLQIFQTASKLPTGADIELYRNHKDNSFREFRRLCADMANEPSYTGKSALVKTLFTKGSDGTGFKGEKLLWCRLLLPGAVKRIYNLQSKQLVKLFSRILHTDLDEMLVDLEQGDVAETVKIFFEKSMHLKPLKKSTLTLYDVDDFLEKLSKMTKEEEQMQHFESLSRRCTANDLKIVIRLVKRDLRINAGPKHILEAIHPDAYQAFQASRDISDILSRASSEPSAGVLATKHSKALSITVSLMTPVQPMLAEPCKAVADALKKCPSGIFSEIKYDGERVQVHKRGSEFKYFSRSLKPVLQHKIAHFKDFIPQAFPDAVDLILDAEILMIDTKTGKPLPFGTLGVHKKTAFQDANVCLFVFDCIYFNGRVLTQTPMHERRKILECNMTEIKHHIMISEMEEMHSQTQLETMITKVFKLGLEGLVLKDRLSIYEPGKRHWLKVKKDYLFGGAMADSVDLVVLGAWYGTGAKGGMMSSFLMGVYDDRSRKWCTVTKVSGGHDDATLAALQKELDMVKISKDATKVPAWLNATKTMVPDFVARNPTSMPVWEVTGAEFTQSDIHTARGISIRFPRVTKIRKDKDWQTATSLKELVNIYEKSKQSEDFTLIQQFPPSKLPVQSSSNSTVTIEDITDIKHKMDGSDDVKCTDVSPPKRRKLMDVPAPEKPLPDFFRGIKLVLPQPTDKELERYFVAYGGGVLPSSSADESTHVIYVDGVCDDQLWPITSRHLDAKWLRDSIKLGSLQEERKYAIHK